MYRNKIFLIAKKEWDRFFGDRRMVINSLLLPGLLLYFVYAFVAPAMVDLIVGGGGENKVYAVNPPLAIQTLFQHAELDLFHVDYAGRENILAGISGMDGNFLLVFPSDFEERLTEMQFAAEESFPEIWFYYNSLAEGFVYHFTKISAIMTVYERSITRKFDINISGGGDLADTSEMGRNFFAAILPMFLLVFIYHAAVASVTEAITGEKERGTLSTILITPITPIELAAGKIFGLSIQSFLCSISGTLGILLSLPRFINRLDARLGPEQGFPSFMDVGAINVSQYGFLDIIFLVILLLSCSLFIVTLIAIVAIHAKSAKEAQMVLSPMVIIVMLIGLLSAFNNAGQHEIFISIIPVYNSVQNIDAILNQQLNLTHVFTAVLSNASFTVIGAIILSRLFTNEKMMTA